MEVVQYLSHSSESKDKLSKILQGVLNHPLLSDVAKQIGYNSSSVCSSNYIQSKKNLAAASNGGDPSQKKKRVTADQQAFIAFAALAVVETPPTSPENETGNDHHQINKKRRKVCGPIAIKDRIKSIGIDSVYSRSHAYRIFNKAEKKEGL